MKRIGSLGRAEASGVVDIAGVDVAGVDVAGVVDVGRGWLHHGTSSPGT
ncbi:MAG: hypothetical protein F2718_00095 [Actinobacteria bacterium]|nr:hypothetical protein [Actinomycetota bacterium]MSZ86050.1 hypothetical protein [Actinomycetota bacterium]MTB24880.1 hypothetical protein [Actinomycetota bacterium]